MMIPIGLHIIQQSGHCKRNISLRITMDCCKHSQTLDPIEGVVSLLEHGNVASDIWHAAIDPGNTFFSIFRKKVK